jgi:pyrimidine operon attenuation protein/uracil phosphoribosyltransferase
MASALILQQHRCERRLVRILGRLWAAIYERTEHATEPARIGLNTRSTWELEGLARELERIEQRLAVAA